MSDERKARCSYCQGLGWCEGTASEHDPRCDGSCSVGCPVPVQIQVECEVCEGLGVENDND